MITAPTVADIVHSRLRLCPRPRLVPTPSIQEKSQKGKRSRGDEAGVCVGGRVDGVSAASLRERESIHACERDRGAVGRGANCGCEMRRADVWHYVPEGTMYSINCTVSRTMHPSWCVCCQVQVPVDVRVAGPARSPYDGAVVRSMITP
jgi:hypothetical protein